MSDEELREAFCSSKPISTILREIYEKGRADGRADAIDESAVAFNELAIKWFNQGCIALGDIPRVVEELKEQK